MARKLTDVERMNLDFLREALCRVLEPSQKNKAASAASALVRVRGGVVTDEDISGIVARFGESAQALGAAMRSEALDPVEGQEGVYTLRVPAQAESAAEKPQEDAGAAGVEADGGPAAEAPESAEVAPAGEDADAPAAPAPEKRAPRRHARRRAAPAEASEAAPAAPVAPVAGDAAPAAGEESAGEPALDKAPEPSESAERPDPAKRAERPGRPERGGRASAPRTQRGRLRRMGKGGNPRPMQLSEVPYVRRGGPAETEVRAKILELDQRFWMNGWLLSHPGAYTLFERRLTAINDALVNGALPGDITRRQLAYQMGGDEKFFEYGSDGHKLLRAMGMEDIIRHRPMPKPDLLYHAPRRRKHMRVLVTENLDPWLDVHDLMYEEGRTTVLGERIHAVVLGGGTPILEHNRLALLLDTLGADSVEVLYWGDIDRAGIDIMVRLRDVLGDHYPFAPFAPAYQLMIDKALERYPDPADNEQTCQVNLGMPDMSLICDGLTEEAAAYARSVVEGCRLIPQEILTRRDL
ncbi:Wadjet anti-phage system protein JetD domain-containing protein [Tractidigestivibacter sp.]|uniref:Wadjet anti-phage system protein JetD domain-containing protein n=1 Tax=Tractidigestivibacter sp. TaxID=2847320 RepID=UPI002A91EDD4|nr:Wadjet anti-phage system protein JetD domain-containing protein [Tractidigestivibacter sp.]MDY5271420.1 DUF2220 family protein [Tractidigestivibacter sp.]